MVTAIVIPIICAYFFWLTGKEMKEQKEKWLQLENVLEESIIVGTIKEIKTEKQRYYYHLHTDVVELVLQTDKQTIRVKRILPLQKGSNPFPFHIGDSVRIYGNWKEDTFRFKRIERRKDKSS